MACLFVAGGVAASPKSDLKKWGKGFPLSDYAPDAPDQCMVGVQCSPSATQRLQDEVLPYLLAKQMGTSVKMLESHYGQVVNSLVAREITKTSTQVKKTRKEGSYPFLNV